MSKLTQGGQTSLHAIRMNVSVLKSLLKCFLIFFLVFGGGIFYLKSDGKSLKQAHNYFQAKFISLYQADPDYKIHIQQNGKNVYVKTLDIINDSQTIQGKNKAVKYTKFAFKYGVIFASISSLILAIYFVYAGHQLDKKINLRGGNIVPARVLTRLVRAYNRRKLLERFFNKNTNAHLKPYKIANGIEFPASTETQHTIITGGSGTGKTQLLKHLLMQIKERGDRAIVYDKMGSFIPYFYEAEKDTILNPFDARSPVWSIFNEIEETLQLDSIASALMPITKNVSDPFWVNASRTIFTSVAGKMKESGELSNKTLVDNLLKSDFSDIAKMIKGTPAQAIIDERSPKTALSVMSVLATYLSSLKYLKDAKVNNDKIFSLQSAKIKLKNNEIFSIRNWIKDDSSSSCLFISSRGDQHESLKPLISAWLEIAINSLLSIKQNNNRRIWIILDELPSLHMLPSLNAGIAESRQFGGCFVLSLQLMAQLRSIYGKDDAETISGLAKTRVIFSSPDEETAKWCSNSLGKKEQQEMKKNISYGANDIRDGVSLNVHQTMENLVIPTEIMNLHNLECYVKLPFDFPIAKTKIKIHKGKEIAERFVKDSKQAKLEKNEKPKFEEKTEMPINNSTQSENKEQKHVENPHKTNKIGDENPRQYLTEE